MNEDQSKLPWAVCGLFALRGLVLALAAVVALYALRTPVLAAQSASGRAVLDMAATAGGSAPPACPVGRTVIPLGRTVGIKLFADGVMVVGLSEIGTSDGPRTPAMDCGMREGDIITHINRTPVNTIEEISALLQSIGSAPMTLRALRGDKLVQMTARGALAADGRYKLGAWIRDSMAGIGTMTFYDPQSGVFGALGHGINDVDTALLMPLSSGSIMYAQVSDVKKGLCGAPGELHGTFQVTHDMGNLYANTPSGVFGLLTDETMAQGLQPTQVAPRREVKTGKATILSNIAGDTVSEYEIEITRIYPANRNDTRNLMLRVTDPRLLETTGGIVQGMSGSPILQDGKLVGAVTHVLVNNPTEGYGILAENMLAQAADQAQARVS